jgi:hypothetical protein
LGTIRSPRDGIPLVELRVGAEEIVEVPIGA